MFAEVAQQVLEYLGVSHDIDVRPSHATGKSNAVMAEDDGGAEVGDINVLYAAANDLPADDPLRADQRQPAVAGQPSSTPAAAANGAKAKPFVAQGAAAPVAPPAAKQPQATGQTVIKQVSVSTAKQLKVPSLVGLPVRKVIEVASASGLDVQITGSGSAREQAPLPGTMVAPGTQIVVRCGR